jgi:hypothetical protein
MDAVGKKDKVALSAMSSNDLCRAMSAASVLKSLKWQLCCVTFHQVFSSTIIDFVGKDVLALGPDLFREVADFNPRGTINWYKFHKPGSLFLSKVLAEACSQGRHLLAKWIVSCASRDSFKFTRAFLDACAARALEIAAWLVELAGPELKRDAVYLRAFSHACSQNDMDVAVWLRSIDPDFDLRDFQDSAFVFACAYGHLKCAQWVKTLAPDIPPNTQHSYALRHAFLNGHFQVVEWLLAMDADKKLWPTFDSIWAEAGSVYPPFFPY